MHSTQLELYLEWEPISKEERKWKLHNKTNKEKQNRALKSQIWMHMDAWEVHISQSFFSGSPETVTLNPGHVQSRPWKYHSSENDVLQKPWRPHDKQITKQWRGYV